MAKRWKWRDLREHLMVGCLAGFPFICLGLYALLTGSAWIGSLFWGNDWFLVPFADLYNLLLPLLIGAWLLFLVGVLAVELVLDWAPIKTLPRKLRSWVQHIRWGFQDAVAWLRLHTHRIPQTREGWRKQSGAVMTKEHPKPPGTTEIYGGRVYFHRKPEKAEAQDGPGKRTQVKAEEKPIEEEPWWTMIFTVGESEGGDQQAEAESKEQEKTPPPSKPTPVSVTQEKPKPEAATVEEGRAMAMSYQGLVWFCFFTTAVRWLAWIFALFALVSNIPALVTAFSPETYCVLASTESQQKPDLYWDELVERACTPEKMSEWRGHALWVSLVAILLVVIPGVITYVTSTQFRVYVNHQRGRFVRQVIYALGGLILIVALTGFAFNQWPYVPYWLTFRCQTLYAVAGQILSQWWAWLFIGSGLLFSLPHIHRLAVAEATRTHTGTDVVRVHRGEVQVIRRSEHYAPARGEDQDLDYPSLPPVEPYTGQVLERVGRQGWWPQRKETRKVEQTRRQAIRIMEADIAESKKRIEWWQAKSQERSVIDEELLRVGRIRNELKRLKLEDKVADKRLEKELEELERDIRLLKAQPPEPKEEAKAKVLSLEEKLRQKVDKVRKGQAKTKAIAEVLEMGEQEKERVRRLDNISQDAKNALKERIEAETAKALREISEM